MSHSLQSLTNIHASLQFDIITTLLSKQAAEARKAEEAQLEEQLRLLQAITSVQLAITTHQQNGLSLSLYIYILSIHYTWIYIYIYIYIHTFNKKGYTAAPAARGYTYIYIYIHTYIHILILICIYIYIYIYIYIHTIQKAAPVARPPRSAGRRRRSGCARRWSRPPQSNKLRNQATTLAHNHNTYTDTNTHKHYKPNNIK